MAEPTVADIAQAFAIGRARVWRIAEIAAGGGATKDEWVDLMNAIAQALADERERARAPFLALANELQSACDLGTGDDYDLALLTYRIRKAAQ